MVFSLALALAANAHLVSAYSPQKGDYFNYSETTTVNNGGGVYTGYTDNLQTTGSEHMDSVNRSLIAASYSYSYIYNDSQGSSTTNSSSGSYTWSTNKSTYVNGTDGQVGIGGIPYATPLYVWFWVNTSLSVGSSFYALNTKFVVLSKNFSLQLPTEQKYIQTIEALGTGQYQRNDSYGIFSASYTWHEYFDPTTGYIVGYNYVELDSGKYEGQVGNFTYTDDLYVTSTSYPLIAANPPSVTTSTTNQQAAVVFPLYLVIIGAVVFLLIIAAVVFAITRRRRGRTLPVHPYTPYTPPNAPPPTPFESKTDLGSKPPEQVVIRDVAMVNCKYCGTLIPTTAETCPYCGGPRR